MTERWLNLIRRLLGAGLLLGGLPWLAVILWTLPDAVTALYVEGAARYAPLRCGPWTYPLVILWPLGNTLIAWRTFRGRLGGRWYNCLEVYLLVLTFILSLRFFVFFESGWMNSSSAVLELVQLVFVFICFVYFVTNRKHYRRILS